jgi:hypothetical protein
MCNELLCQNLRPYPHLQFQQYTGQMSASRQELLWRTVHQQWVLIADSTILPSTFFSLTGQLGHILVVPKHTKIVSYYKRFGRVMDTNSEDYGC